MTGNTINIMSLGGMALAIGILVDEATVTIENTHVQMERTSKIATAVLNASNATAVPRLLALLCILSVFIPAFVMEDPLRSLFMPLTLAVGFAMISSYLLSSTFVPIMSVYLLKHKKSQPDEGEKEPGLFDRIHGGYHGAVDRFVGLRWLVVPIYLGACWPDPGRAGAAGRHRAVPADRRGGVRAAVPAAARVELRADPGDGPEVPPGDRARGGDGERRDHRWASSARSRPNFGIDNMVLFMRGPDDGWLRVALNEDSGIKLDEFRERLRKVLPERVVPWLAQRLEKGGGQGGLPRDGGTAAGRAVHLRIRAGRHRQPGHELRRLEADRGPPDRHRLRRGPQARGEDRRRAEADPPPPRRRLRADARLSHGRGRDRPRAGRA